MIRVLDLVRHYDGGLLPALNGVSLQVGEGEVVAVVGPSGSGKSTLLKLIGAIDRSTSGRVEIGGRPLEAYRPFSRFRARWIGFVFQFHHLLSHLTLVENVELPMIPLGVPRAARRRRALGLLEEVGLAPRAHARPGRVAGGERQRASIARALANDPPVVLADEPTGSLDTETGDRVFALLLERCRRRGAALLVVTHNPQVASAADRVVRLVDGRVRPEP